jgi:hypothetical protein
MTRPEETPCPNPLCAGVLDDHAYSTEGHCSSCGYRDSIYIDPITLAEDLSEDREDQAE